MFGFMTAVLMSNLFWIGYGFASLVVTTIFIRKFAPVTYLLLTKGKERAHRLAKHQQKTRIEHHDAVMLVMLIVVTWPVIISAIVLFKLVMLGLSLFGKTVGLAFRSIDSIIPKYDIKVIKKTNDDE